jgi:DNA repair protein RadC
MEGDDMNLAYSNLSKKGKKELLAMVRELTKDYKVSRPTESCVRIREHITDWEKEHVIILFLDVSGRIVSSKLYTIGTPENCFVFPKEVIRDALMQTPCKSIIFGHNHPTGELEFSVADKQIIRKLKQMLEVFDMELLDSIIVTATSFASAKEEVII